MSKLLAILGCLLLLPSVLYLLGFLVSVLNTAQQLLLFGAPEEPMLLMETIRFELIGQIFSGMVLLPGIITLSVASFKYDANQYRLYRKVLTIYAVILLLTFPILSFMGVYLLWLKKQRLV